MNRKPQRRRGFTLVELLIVISIIIILTAMTFGLFKAATNANRKAKAKGDIQAMKVACEIFKKNYGDYPCRASSGNTSTARRELFDQLIGRRIVKAFPIANGGTNVELIAYNDARLATGSGGRKMKPLIEYGAISSNNDAGWGLNDWTGGSPTAYQFQDPWGNAYDYRYRVLNAPGSPIQDANTGVYLANYAIWKTSGFLIVSAGANFVAPSADGLPLADNEYWDDSGASPMSTTGVITSTYRDEPSNNGPFRADNITSWEN